MVRRMKHTYPRAIAWRWRPRGLRSVVTTASLSRGGEGLRGSLPGREGLKVVVEP